MKLDYARLDPELAAALEQMPLSFAGITPENVHVVREMMAAMRVPVPNGSVVDLVTIMKRDVTVEEVREAVRAAAETDRLKATLRYSTEALVSSDIVGDPHSSIFDSEYTSVIEGNMLKTLSWYDNERGYSNRVVDLLDRMYALG